MRRVLMIAFHFPPMKGSSGLQRTLNFVRDLGELGWQPRVLSAWRPAYSSHSDEQMQEIPPSVVVRRIPCLDVARHTSFSGAYPGFLGRPDRWSSWLPALIAWGLAECAVWKPHLIWATFPIPTAVVGGRMLSRFCGIPAILDLRDSMTEENYPPDPVLRRSLRRIESSAMHHARAVVFTSPGAVEMYARRYPDIPAARWNLIPNGFDEEQFKKVESQLSGRQPVRHERLVLLHSGLLDPVDRDPTSFFDALAALKARHEPLTDRLQVRLRASGHDAVLGAAIRTRGLEGIVELAPALPYDEALREMLEADGLLLFQGPNCNHQTPAKVYEYFRAGRPILAITDAGGDTAAAVRAAGLLEASIVPIHDAMAIETGLRSFLAALRTGNVERPGPELVRQWSRSLQSRRLAELMDRIATGS